jgi:glutamate--tRNA ligase
MRISHVIRGEEWLPSMGLHVLLYEAMGWEAPQFAHLSLILKPEGKGKLSKRDGAKFGFPVFPLDFHDKASGETYKGYREEGYFPEAFVNFLALLGWSPAEDREILSLEEMAQEFDLYKVHKAGARFSKEKAEWFNHQYLQKKSNTELVALLKQIEEVKKANLSEEKLEKIVSLMKERASFVKDIYHDGKFFFETPLSYDEKAVKKALKVDTFDIIDSLMETLKKVDFNTECLKETIHHFAESKNIGIGKVMMPLRLCLVGGLKGPDVPDILEILGKEESMYRVRAWKEYTSTIISGLAEVLRKDWIEDDSSEKLEKIIHHFAKTRGFDPENVMMLLRIYLVEDLFDFAAVPKILEHFNKNESLRRIDEALKKNL